ncbi:MAG TPA: amidophosphoribosyltransferase [Candidatus Poseidoniales archaeon]|jgi:amidophosphoribosyltransferase|nr:MAG: amidophosphoribosyltransferase [Euryarchaeota archaeon]HIG03577.1 amidophosphoribosyltransferase [Candidatus Poseidoniales archaeon]HIK78008.1 amidophosphoribosyltransferase [Candidatus Poseidoniales archaeon]
MCGILGIVANYETPVNQDLYDGLLVLQHRGQDAAGIVTCDGKRFRMRKSSGLVTDVFYKRHMKSLVGHMGIGHVRYPTAGTSSRAESQPFYVNSPYGITLAHNGNLTNAEQLKEHLTLIGRHQNTSSDSEALLNIFAAHLSNKKRLNINGESHLDIEDVFSSVGAVYEKCNGSYAIVAMISGFGVLGFRDPNGIRPLILGRRIGASGSEEWCMASESVALITLGFDIVRDILPGEAAFITTGGELFTRVCAEGKVHSPCIFEYVYFARPDSIIDGISVHEARRNMGIALADRIIAENPNHEIDVVIPIPDSGRISALALAERLGVSYREGFVKNRYVGRTFIMPGQEMRKDSVRKKLNVMPKEFEGRNVLLVDDSIVRGNTSKKIIEMSRDAGAKTVSFASAAPPVCNPNVYGIDMPAASELIATGRTNAEIAEQIGCDKMFYQTIEDLVEACSIGENPPSRFDSSCFDGNYVTGDVTAEYLAALELARHDDAKQGIDMGDEIIEIHNEA